MGPVISLFGRPLWRENLVWLELASALRELPKPSRASDPRPTLLIPGFLSGDRHLVIMKHWLERAGHATRCAGIRWNVDCSAAAIARLEERLEAFSAAQGQPVVLIGQSRGGLFARVLAVRRPDLVQSVVSLGSPHRDPMRVHPALWLQGASLALLGSLGIPGILRHSCRSGQCCTDFRNDLAAPFPEDVQFYSIYSRKDGIVDWRACLDEAAKPIQIDSTHCGMALHPSTYRFLDELLNRPAATARRRSGARASAPALAKAA